MQNVLIDKPYEFIPAFRSRFVSTLIRETKLYKRVLRRDEAVYEFDVRNVDRFKATIDAGHSIIVAPNHSRTSDPLVIGELACTARCYFFAMASWHLFHVSRFKSWMMRGLGAFSVYREGLDRKAVATAIEILVENQRPLLLFPEGTTSRTNDQLMELLDGVSMIAHRAARQRDKRDGGKVVVHPVALKYVMLDSIDDVAGPVLEDIEQQLGWPPSTHFPLLDRVNRLATAVQALKECEFIGTTIDEQNIDKRRKILIDEILEPIERQWLGKTNGSSPVVRVKNLRMKIMPEILSGELDSAARDECWRQLNESYYAQQFGYFVPGYVESFPTHDRIRETIEKIEDVLRDASSKMGRLKAIIDVGPSIEVPTSRKRNKGVDELTVELGERLQSMLDKLASESRPYVPPESD